MTCKPFWWRKMQRRCWLKGYSCEQQHQQLAKIGWTFKWLFSKQLMLLIGEKMTITYYPIRFNSCHAIRLETLDWRFQLLCDRLDNDIMTKDEAKRLSSFSLMFAWDWQYLIKLTFVFDRRNTQRTKHSFHLHSQLVPLRDSGGQWCHLPQSGNLALISSFVCTVLGTKRAESEVHKLEHLVFGRILCLSRVSFF